MKEIKWIVGLIVVLIILVGAVWLFTAEEEAAEDDHVTEHQEEEEVVDVVSYTDIGTQAAYELTQTEADLFILDVSPNYDEGHIYGAANYYVGDGTLDANIDKLDKDVPYLVYCHVDSAAIAGAEKLIEAGFETVYRLEGNYAAWEEGGYPVEIPLTGLNGYEEVEANATRSYLDDQFGHLVRADLDIPESGKFYEGWLVDPDTDDFFSTGIVENIDGVWELQYMSENDDRDYSRVVITLETEEDGLDGVPETHIYEGEFN